MNRKTVLVVDDSESICSVIASLLELRGYSARVAYDGEEGVELARELRPSAILLDIMMPVMDGWGALKRLKADPRTSSIPVIALTALRLPEEQLHAAGFMGYLSKPIPAHRLSEEIDRACGDAVAS